MEKVDFLQKPIELAQSSQQFIERLWRTGTEVSKLCAPITSFFSFFFRILFNAILQELSFNKAIYEFTLTRFDLVFPYDLWAERVTQLEEEYFVTETGKPSFSFLLNFSMVRKLASDLATRIVTQTPKYTLFPPVAPLLEPEITEEVSEKPLEEAPEKTLVHRIAELQSEFGSKLAPSIKSVSSALLEFERQAIPLALFAAMPQPVLLDLAGFEGLASYRFAVPLEKETVEASLAERPSDESPRAPSLYKEMIAEAAPLGLTLGVRFSPEALRSFSYATELPEVVSEYQKPIMAETAPVDLTASFGPSPEALRAFSYATELPAAIPEYQTPLIKIATTLSRISSPPVTISGPSVEPYHYPAPSETPTPMPLSEISLLLREISPSLASWIYGESEILRSTRVSLSAVPVAASTAEKLVTETLTQPTWSLETPRAYGARGPISKSLMPARHEARVRDYAVEAFRLPSIVTSLAASYVRAYPLLFAEPAVSEIYKTSFEVGSVYAEQPTTPSEILEQKKFHRLPIMLALAGAESLITQRLQHELTEFAKEAQIVRSKYGEALAELGTAGPIRTTMLGELASGLTFPYTIEPYTSSAPPVSLPPRRPSPISSPIQDTINLTISAETAEEDLRDLERKISRILSEQISRYYGSSRI